MKITLVAVFLATSSLTSTGTGTTTLMTSTTLPLTTTVTRGRPAHRALPDARPRDLPQDPLGAPGRRH